jgi:hypothetical protein
MNDEKKMKEKAEEAEDETLRNMTKGVSFVIPNLKGIWGFVYICQYTVIGNSSQSCRGMVVMIFVLSLTDLHVCLVQARTENSKIPAGDAAVKRKAAMQKKLDSALAKVSEERKLRQEAESKLLAMEKELGAAQAALCKECEIRKRLERQRTRPEDCEPRKAAGAAEPDEDEEVIIASSQEVNSAINILSCLAMRIVMFKV